MIAVIVVVRLSLAEMVFIRPTLRDIVVVRLSLQVVVIKYSIPANTTRASKLSLDVVALVKATVLWIAGAKLRLDDIVRA